MKKEILYMRQYFGNTLNTRDEAQKLFRLINENHIDVSQVFINFEGVDFMSRSFADEFHKLKMNWTVEHSDSNIDIENADVQIIQILQAVAKTQTGRIIKNAQPTTLSFTNMQQLSDFLQSV